MIGRIAIIETGPTPIALANNRTRVEVNTAAVQKSLIRWHTEFRPLHFSNAASRRYTYLPRAGERGNSRKKFANSYTGQKLQKYGHTRPLEWSGRSRRETSKRRINVKKRTGAGKLIMYAPGFNRRNPYSRINMRDELTTITPSEETGLQITYGGSAVETLKGIRRRRFKGIK